MRTRTLLTSQGAIASREYAWDKTSEPYRESDVLHPYDTQPSYYEWTVPLSWPKYKSVMQDDTGTGGIFRPCIHTTETNDFDAPFIRHRYFRGYGGTAYLQGIQGTVITGLVGSSLPFDAPDWQALADEALRAMSPTSNDGISFINSLIELKDLKRMNPVPSLLSLRKKHPTLRQLAGNKKLRRRFYRSTVKRLNNAFLNANLGIVPTVLDAVRIHDSLVSLTERLGALRRGANRRQQRHYTRVLTRNDGTAYRNSWQTSTAVTPGWVHPVRADLLGGGFRPNISLFKRYRWTDRPTYHATMRFTYTLPPLGDFMTKALYFLDNFGIRFDPSVVWNALPFTFLVDYIVDVGGWLGQFARNNLPININLQEFCHSVSWRKEFELWIQYPDDPHPSFSTQTYINRFGPPNGRGASLVYRGTRKSYTRLVTNPGHSTEDVQIKSPTLRQLSIAGSLLGARGLGDKTRWRAR
jgi:hypothetical protein